jgi:hypothetical protein
MVTRNNLNSPSMRLGQVVIRLAEACRLVGGIGFILILVFFLRLIAENPTYIYHQEIAALEGLKAEFSQANTSKNASADRVTELPEAAESASGVRTTNRYAAAAGVPIVIGGIAVGSMPAVVWIAICIIACIYLVQAVVWAWTEVVQRWAKVWLCSWTESFWSFLGCLWNFVWTVIATISTVLLTIFLVIMVVYNIAAFIAAL